MEYPRLLRDPDRMDLAVTSDVRADPGFSREIILLHPAFRLKAMVFDHPRAENQDPPREGACLGVDAWLGCTALPAARHDRLPTSWSPRSENPSQLGYDLLNRTRFPWTAIWTMMTRLKALSGEGECLNPERPDLSGAQRKMGPMLSGNAADPCGTAWNAWAGQDDSNCTF